MKKKPVNRLKEITIQLPDDFEYEELLIAAISEFLTTLGLEDGSVSDYTLDENGDKIFAPVVDPSFVSELEIEILNARYSGKD